MQNNEKLIYQFFIGKVSDMIGYEKTIQLLNESKEAFKYYDEKLNTYNKK